MHRALASALTARIVTTLVAGAAILGRPAAAQAQDAAELAKQLANPVASLVSVPFQANWDGPLGPNGDARSLINIQPVMPFSMNADWNLIARVIVPVLSQPPLAEGESARFGLSDVLVSAFVSPASSRVVWGIGPAASLPMSADPFLGTGKVALGPTAVVLKQSGGYTYGALANHLFSVAGSDSRDSVNQTFLQPFLTYSTPSGWSFTVSSESVGNWESTTDETWTVPLIGIVSKVVRLGKRPITVGAGYGYYVAGPEGGPSWKVRGLITLLFPK